MPDDILDAAQKAINDAAGAGTPPVGAEPAAAQPPPPPPVEPPPEPAPVPMSSPEPTAASVPAPMPAPSLASEPVSEPMPSPSSAQSPTAPAATPVNPQATDILSSVSPDSTIVPPVRPAKSSVEVKPKKKISGALIAVIITILLALPVGVYFISQQNQSIADIRNRAWGTNYKQCQLGTNGNDQGSCPAGQVCHCQDGDMCTETACEPEDGTKASCKNQGRAWCVNDHGYAMTCCYPGYNCCKDMGIDNNGCCEVNKPPKTPRPPTEPPNNTSTPTPTTPTTNPVCQDVKLYKNGTQVTALTTLKPGDDVVLAVKGNLTPTKAHFRVNGKKLSDPTTAGWDETTTKNSSGEFTIDYTIPSGVSDFVIEGEVFTNGAWH